MSDLVGFAVGAVCLFVVLALSCAAVWFAGYLLASGACAAAGVC